MTPSQKQAFKDLQSLVDQKTADTYFKKVPPAAEPSNDEPTED